METIPLLLRCLARYREDSDTKKLLSRPGIGILTLVWLLAWYRSRVALGKTVSAKGSFTAKTNLQFVPPTFAYGTFREDKLWGTINSQVYGFFIHTMFMSSPSQLYLLARTLPGDQTRGNEELVYS